MISFARDESIIGFERKPGTAASLSCGRRTTERQFRGYVLFATVHGGHSPVTPEDVLRVIEE